MVRTARSALWVLAIIVFTSRVADATNGKELPRSYGGFTLGMSVNDFRIVTGIQPESCLHCVKDELYAAYPRSSPARTSGVTVYSQGDDVNERNSILCFFIRGKLYRIETGENYGAKGDAVVKKYVLAFGQSPRVIKFKNGTTQLVWKDKNTVFYVVQEDGNDQASETVYLDKQLDPYKSY